MRSIKTTGGLTRGHGMAESHRIQWLLSMPAYTEVNSAMQDLTDTYFATSEQHKAVTPARQNKDETDKKTLLGFLQDRNPFQDDTSLRNIATVITASKGVTANRAKDVGCKILGNMTGQNVVDHTFKKKEKVMMMSAFSSNWWRKNSSGSAAPLPTFGDGCRWWARQIVDHFKYELCRHPSVMFEPNGLMRAADKPELADTTTIVFDGYSEGLSYKDTAHLWLSAGVVGIEVTLNGSVRSRYRKNNY